MADKNTVEIPIRARDATGPGIDSATKNLDRLKKQVSDIFRGAGLAAGAQFFGAALNNTMTKIIDLQSQVVQGFVHIEDAATEAALSIAKGLPVVGNFFAAGQQIRSLLDGSAEANARAKMDAIRAAQMDANQRNDANAIRSLQGALNPYSDRLRMMGTGDTFEDQRIAELLKKEKDEKAIQTMEAIRANLARSGDKNIQAEAQRMALEIETASQTVTTAFNQAIKKIDEAEAFEAVKLRNEASRVNVAALRERADQLAATNRSSDARAMLTRFFEQRGDLTPGPESASMDQLRLMVGRSVQRVSPASLGSGEQSRFTTGLRESSQEAMRAEAQKANATSRELLETLKKILAVAEQQAEEQGERIEIEFMGGLR